MTEFRITAIVYFLYDIHLIPHLLCPIEANDENWFDYINMNSDGHDKSIKGFIMMLIDKVVIRINTKQQVSPQITE